MDILDKNTVDKLKNSLYITHCQSKAGEKYWLVMSKRPKDIYASTIRREIKTEKNKGLYSPESILEALVDSGFDLSIFDQPLITL